MNDSVLTVECDQGGVRRGYTLMMPSWFHNDLEAAETYVKVVQDYALAELECEVSELVWACRPR